MKLSLDTYSIGTDLSLRDLVQLLPANGFDGVEIIEGRTGEAGDQWLKSRLYLAVAGGAQGRHGSAVKRAIGDDSCWYLDAFVIAVKARQFYGRFVGFGT